MLRAQLHPADTVSQGAFLLSITMLYCYCQLIILIGEMTITIRLQLKVTYLRQLSLFDFPYLIFEKNSCQLEGKNRKIAT